jgi:RNA polymerase sigma-70 factor (ECF subfamily)
MSDESREWVERASGGDVLAVEELFARHLPGLQAYVRAQAGGLLEGKESSSDLVQSACREVLSHLERFRYDGEEGFKRWLYATALRKIRDRYRYHTAQKRDAGREARPADPPASVAVEHLLVRLRSASSPSGPLAAREEFARVERVLEELPASYRDVIRLAYLDELPRREIAERMGLSEANARMLLSRALARLARLLEE